MFPRFLKLVLCVLCVSTFCVSSIDAESVFYDFANIDGFDQWGNKYQEHVVEYTDGAITFRRANHQSGSNAVIKNIPVVNKADNSSNNDILFVLKGDGYIRHLEFTCRQWGSKEITVSLHTSTDRGATFTDTKISTTISGTDSILVANDLKKINAVKFTFNNKNQVGIASLSFDLVKHESIPSHAVRYYVNGELMRQDSIKEGDSFRLPEPANVPDGVSFMGWTTTPMEGKQDFPPSMVRESEMDTSDMAFYAVFATQEVVEENCWQKMSVTELFANRKNGIYAITTADGYAFDGNIVISSKKYFDAEITAEAFVFDENGIAAVAPEGTCELKLSFDEGDQVVIQNEATNQVLSTMGGSRTLTWVEAENNHAPSWYLYDRNLRSNNQDACYLRTYVYNKSIRAYAGALGDSICFVYKVGSSYRDYCTTVKNQPNSTTVVIADCGYTTICLSYPAVIQEKASLYALRCVDEKGLYFAQVDTLMAGKGYLVQGVAGDTIALTEVFESSAHKDNLMDGVVERTLCNSLLLQGSGEYAYPWILAKDGTFKRYTGEYIPAGKAYVDGVLIQSLKSDESANALRIHFEGEETAGVRSLTDEEKREVSYYNLQGQRIVRPTHPRTLYIERGKRKSLMK